jgi:prefoldin subunit 5
MSEYERLIERLDHLGKSRRIEVYAHTDDLKNAASAIRSLSKRVSELKNRKQTRPEDSEMYIYKASHSATEVKISSADKSDAIYRLAEAVALTMKDAIKISGLDQGKTLIIRNWVVTHTVGLEPDYKRKYDNLIVAVGDLVATYNREDDTIKSLRECIEHLQETYEVVSK